MLLIQHESYLRMVSIKQCSECDYVALMDECVGQTGSRKKKKR